MRAYTVHLPPEHDADPLLIKEGFSFCAFLFPLFWALYHRLWVESAVLILIGAVLFVAQARWGVSPNTATALGLAVQTIFAFEARDFLRANLTRRGWWQTAVIFGRNIDAATQRWYHFAGSER
jgi:hypothetical protein